MQSMSNYGIWEDSVHNGMQVSKCTLKEADRDCLPRAKYVWQKCEKSPHILRPLDSIERDDKTILIFPRVCTLKDYLKKHRENSPVICPFNRDRFAMDIALALNDFADRSLLHRNVSSSTIFISCQGHILLGSFFLAREYDDVVSQNVANELWTAPEILNGAKDYDFAVDVYSYGVILTELATLRRPFYPISMKELQRNLHQWVGKEGRTPSLSEACPGWYRDLATSCLAFEREHRPSFQQIVKIFQDRKTQQVDH